MRRPGGTPMDLNELALAMAPIQELKVVASWDKGKLIETVGTS